jgi:pimeloyl-ACP methyl ester carboxylesterase
MIELVLVAFAAVLAVPTAGTLGYRAFKRSRGARLMRIENPNGVDEQGYVRIGGIDQWISIRGEDLANPVILEIHGGPGFPNSIFGVRTRSWEKHFTIVRWDMRGSGRTFGGAGAEGQGEMSFTRLCEDALEVTHHVRARLGVDQMVLLANSFGSVVGLRLARQHPHLYSAYVGTDQNIHDGGVDTSAHQALLARLRAAGKRRALAAVEEMGPDKRRWTARQHAHYAKLSTTSDPLTTRTLKTVVVRSLWFSPSHSLREIGQVQKGMSFSERIVPETAAFDDWADGTRFELPFFIFQGDKDVLTPPDLAKRFFDDVQAPAKRFGLIEDASHFASFLHPEQFLRLMLTHVRPMVTGQRHAVAE